MFTQVDAGKYNDTWTCELCGCLVAANLKAIQWHLVWHRKYGEYIGLPSEAKDGDET